MNKRNIDCEEFSLYEKDAKLLRLSTKATTQYQFATESEAETADTEVDPFLTVTKPCSAYHPERIDTAKPTESRIEYVRSVLNGKDLKPMIDFDPDPDLHTINLRLNKRIIDVRDFFISMNVKLNYLKSGTTGHTFKAVSRADNSIKFAVKVCAYPKDKYGAMNNTCRPENAELRMVKLLSQYVVGHKTPHFVLPIGTFNTSITNFINIPKNKINLDDEKNEMYKKFIERYYDGEFEDFVSILISEWCNGGDLLDYIRTKYTTMTLKHWIVIIFQLLFTLASVHQKYPAFRHNDLKANNILIRLTNLKQDLRYKYSLEGEPYLFIIPNINMMIKIWDFDFACITDVVENNKVNARWAKKMNITKKENRYYDMHYFFNTLTSKRFFPQFYDGGAPPEIVAFVHRIIPEKFRNGSKYINKKGRIQVDFEYTTPYKVIAQDPLFAKYRFIDDDN